jgi:hypothetical protein
VYCGRHGVGVIGKPASRLSDCILKPSTDGLAVHAGRGQDSHRIAETTDLSVGGVRSVD